MSNTKGKAALIIKHISYTRKLSFKFTMLKNLKKHMNINIVAKYSITIS